MKNNTKEWDSFFYYGLSDLENEIRQDLLNGIATSKKKLFFNRSDSAGTNDFLNTPSGLAIQIGLKYAIVNWLAYRNTYTGDGTNGSKERRIATSQNQVTISVFDNGEIDVSLFYIPFFNIEQNRTLPIQIGGV